MKLPKIAVVISHPIQHFCPQFISYTNSKAYKTKIFFASSAGVNVYKDPTFKKDIKWANLNLDQFDHEFLNEGKVVAIDKYLDARDLENRLNEFEPDAVLIFGYSQKLQRRAYRWANKNSKKIVYFADSELRQTRTWYRNIIKKLILKKYFHNIDAILTIGDANEEYYRYYGVEDTKLLRSAYPIDIILYEEAYKNKIKLNGELRKKYAIAENDIVITVVGKLVNWKRQNDIIKAMIEMDKTYNNFKVFIIGTGEQEDLWKKEASKIKNNKIIFTGFVNPEDLPKYYSATDIYIHPAEIEPHSVAISEAIYMGTPIIISNKCGSYGPNDDVQNGFNGFVFKCGNIQDLVFRLQQLSTNVELRNYFAINSRNYAVKAQNLAHSVGLLKALIYINLISKP